MSAEPHDSAAASPAAGETALARAFALISAFMLVELAGAYVGNSLALAADAVHMFLDASALGMSWLALRLSRRAPNGRFTYGYQRFQVLAAFVNALALFAACGWILFEAASRLRAPEPILPLPVLAVAAVGFVVNAVAWRMLHGAGDNLNIRSAALHVLGDLLGSVAAMASALAVLWFDWRFADPVLAAVIVAILARGAWRVLKISTYVLLEAAPPGVDIDELRAALIARVPGIVDIHRVHIWALTGERPMLTLHAAVDDTTDALSTVNRIKAVLSDSFGIAHSTVQIERGDCPDERVPAERSRRP